MENVKKDNINNGVKGKSTFKNDKIIIGECVVVNDNRELSNFELDDKILICEVTTAKDVKYLTNIKALIVNSGGILSHSAIFSREFNIPCLMGCEIATNVFNTGEIVLYDVSNEFVELYNNGIEN